MNELEVYKEKFSIISKNSEVIGIERLRNIYNYDNVSKSLIVRLMNYDRNRARMKKLVYQVVGDVAFVLYVIIRKEAEGYAAMQVERQMFDRWKASKKEAFETAIANTKLLYEARIYKNGFKENTYTMEDVNLQLNKGYSVNALTNCYKRNGATAIFYPGVKEKIAELFKDDYYIVFTSIHEVMLHAKTEVSPERLKRSLLAVNRGSEPRDILTETIYYYSREENKIYPVM